MNNKIARYKKKRILFILDTNIYRRISELVKDEQVKWGQLNSKQIDGNKYLLKEMKEREIASSCQTIMSLSTSRELLRHLEDGDKEKYEKCLLALRYMYFHSQYGKPVSHITDFDSVLSEFFFGIGSDNERFFVSGYIMDVLNKIYVQENMTAVKEEIKKINSDFLGYKREFYNLFESLLQHPQNGSLNWSFYDNDINLRFIIDKQHYIECIGSYLIGRVQYIRGSDLSNEISKEKRNEFYQYFTDALEMFRYLFEQLYNNGESLKVLERNKKWNSIIDFHLVFEWCFLKWFNKDKSVEVVLVTNDKKGNLKIPNYRRDNKIMLLHEIYDDVWDLWDYFEFLGFSVDRSSPKNPILKLPSIIEPILE
jgi:hypothetical protein